MEVTDEKADFGCRNKVGRTEKVGGHQLQKRGRISSHLCTCRETCCFKDSGDLSVMQWNIPVVSLWGTVVV